MGGDSDEGYSSLEELQTPVVPQGNEAPAVEQTLGFLQALLQMEEEGQVDSPSPDERGLFQPQAGFNLPPAASGYGPAHNAGFVQGTAQLPSAEQVNYGNDGTMDPRFLLRRPVLGQYGAGLGYPGSLSGPFPAAAPASAGPAELQPAPAPAPAPPASPVQPQRRQRKEYKCALAGCGASYADRSNRDRHMKGRHGLNSDLTPFQRMTCRGQGCGKRFPRSDNRVRHERTCPHVP
jgi:hypothetical protein